jgi:hypothetical protein
VGWKRGDLTPQNLEDHGTHVIAIESVLQRAQLVQNTAKSPNVTLEVIRPVFTKFW